MPEHEFHAVVPNPSRTAVLVAGRRLPSVRVAPVRRLVPAAVEAFASEHGVTAPFLRALEILVEDDRVAGLLEFDASERAEPGDWLELERLEQALPAPPELTDALARWRAELGAVPLERPPWARPGWRAEAEAWIREVFPATRSIELVRQWPLSCVLRAERAGGRAYFKAVFALFRHEPAVTRTLDREHRGLVPEILAVEPDRGWLLMREVGAGGELDAVPETRWPEAMRALATVHRAWEGRRDEVCGLGAPDRSLEVLTAELPGAFVDAGVDAAAVLELERRAHELARLALAETLVHGDFHPWNVAEHAGRVVIYDWSDACFAHPLFDLLTFAGEAGKPVPPRALHAYAAARDDVRADDMQRAFELAEPLGCVHVALTYTRITEALEPADRYLFDRVPRQFLERAVELL